MTLAKPIPPNSFRRRRSLGWLAVALLAGCSSISSNIKYQQAAAVTDQLNQHAFVLHHTPAGSYTYDATTPTQGKVVLSVAGITDHDDQNAILKVLEAHRFDTHRDWDEIRVLFYEKTVPTPQGAAYVNLLRQETIE
jgi:hypothetical protein